jgi:quercetin dioxygenase-like cupin family protein
MATPAPTSNGSTPEPGEHQLARRQLGRAIRAARQAQKATLAEVAARADVSISLLSQVERGQVDPSLESLRSIAAALETTPFKLLSDDSHRLSVVRAGRGRLMQLTDGDGCYEVLTAWENAAAGVVRWTLEPGHATLEEPQPHDGEEAIFVLSGRAEVQIGEETFEIGRGDFIAYDAHLPHRVKATDEEQFQAIIVTVPPY